MGAGKVFASVLAGAAAGAVLGILFAPDKGTETRRKIAEKGSDLAGTVKIHTMIFQTLFQRSMIQPSKNYLILFPKVKMLEKTW